MHISVISETAISSLLHSQSTWMKEEKKYIVSPWHPQSVKEADSPISERLAGCSGGSTKCVVDIVPGKYYAWWPWHSHRFCAPGGGWGGCAPCLLHGDPQGRSCLPHPGQKRGASVAPCACSEPWSSVPEKGKASALMCYAVAQRKPKESHVRPERALV